MGFHQSTGNFPEFLYFNIIACRILHHVPVGIQHIIKSVGNILLEYLVRILGVIRRNHDGDQLHHDRIIIDHVLIHMLEMVFHPFAAKAPGIKGDQIFLHLLGQLQCRLVVYFHNDPADSLHTGVIDQGIDVFILAPAVFRGFYQLVISFPVILLLKGIVQQPFSVVIEIIGCLPF